MAYEPCLCLSSLVICLHHFIICLLFLRDCDLWALSLSLFFGYLSPSFHYLSLILKRLCDLSPVSPSFLFQRDSVAAAPYCLCLSPSVTCLLVQRDPVAAAPQCLCLPPSIICLFQRDSMTYEPCHCLPLLLFSVSCFRETLWLLLLCGEKRKRTASYINR